MRVISHPVGTVQLLYTKSHRNPSPSNSGYSKARKVHVISGKGFVYPCWVFFRSVENKALRIMRFGHVSMYRSLVTYKAPIPGSTGHTPYILRTYSTSSVVDVLDDDFGKSPHDYALAVRICEQLDPVFDFIELQQMTETGTEGDYGLLPPVIDNDLKQVASKGYTVQRPFTL